MSDDLHAPIDLRDAPDSRHILDITDGLERVMGDRALYTRMLRRFLNDYADGTRALEDALDGGALADAHFLCVTLSGAAGVLGAHAVHEGARALDAALCAGAEAGPLCADLSRQMAELLQRLDALIHPAPPA